MGTSFASAQDGGCTLRQWRAISLRPAIQTLSCSARNPENAPNRRFAPDGQSSVDAGYWIISLGIMIVCQGILRNI
jgi:hypothetical protein